MDKALANELVGMAEEQVLAVGAFHAQVASDPGLAGAVRERLGWDASQDPVEIWRDGPPRSPLTVDLETEWPDAPAVVRTLVGLAAGHEERLRRVLDRHGWPGRSLAGEDGADAAWMVAMHADRDAALQRRCAGLLEEAVEQGEADPRHLAALVDRVAGAEHGDQVFGTLALVRDGRPLFLVPVRDPEGLDDRRRAIGLRPVQDDLGLEAGQLPYRHLRRSPEYQWPSRR